MRYSHWNVYSRSADSSEHILIDPVFCKQLLDAQMKTTGELSSLEMIEVSVPRRFRRNYLNYLIPGGRKKEAKKSVSKLRIFF
jgi:hypothetical protein